jgi:expansin
MYAAIDTNNYGASTACGKCVSLTGTTGVTVTLTIVDQCPAASNAMWCQNANHLDLSTSVYGTVEPGQPGSINNTPGHPITQANYPGPVNWHYVPCPVGTSPIVYDFNTSSSGYLAMVIENSRYGIKSVSYRSSGGGNFNTMGAPTNADPHWKVTSNPPNPIDFQVTDEYNQVLIDTGISWSGGAKVNGRGQFAQCN